MFYELITLFDGQAHFDIDVMLLKRGKVCLGY